MDDNMVLGLCSRTFDAFESRGLPYCHWKSNEHLGAGLRGETDLDILIDAERRSDFVSTVTSLGYHRFPSVRYLTYNGIEDFIGLDEATGCLVHLHAHFELRIGKKFLKDVHLPWEPELLGTRMKDELYDVFIAAPEYELLMLLIRRALKNKLNPKAALSEQVFSSGETAEFRYLKERIDPAAFERISEKLLGSGISSRMMKFIDDQTGAVFRSISRDLYRIGPPLSSSSMPGMADAFYFLRKIQAARRVLLHKKLRCPIPYRRTLPMGGKIVAVLGADGAGKSTILSAIQKRFSWKLDIHQVYFGSGDGESSLLRAPLRAFARLRSTKRGDVTAVREKDRDESNKRSGLRAARTVWAVLLAFEKKGKFSRVRKAKERGLLVLTDRYPQTQFPGLNDGPLLVDWAESPNPFKRALARWETRIYALSADIFPDLVIKLTVPVEVALERKKDTPEFVVRRKAQIIHDLEFPHSVVAVVSTDTTLETSVAQVSAAIWKTISR